jgi:hypothetical protein
VRCAEDAAAAGQRVQEVEQLRHQLQGMAARLGAAEAGALGGEGIATSAQLQAGCGGAGRVLSAVQGPPSPKPLAAQVLAAGATPALPQAPGTAPRQGSRGRPGSPPGRDVAGGAATGQDRRSSGPAAAPQPGSKQSLASPAAAESAGEGLGQGLLQVARAAGSCPDSPHAGPLQKGAGAAAGPALPGNMALPAHSTTASTGLRGAWTAGNERLTKAAAKQQNRPPIFL